jgi:hypothetical protein
MVPRDVDDRAPAGAGHHLGRRARSEPGALEIDGDDPVPLVLGGPPDRLAGEDVGAGVVDPDVDTPEPPEGRVAQPLDVLAPRDVRAHRDGAPALAHDLRHDGLGLDLRVRVVHHHVGALGGEGQGDRPSDPAAGAGHHRDVLSKSPHRVSPLRL